jgi:hypothetical protein
MNTESLYHELKEVAEKLDITVLEQSFRGVGFPVKSGLCKIRGKDVFVMDKQLAVSTKIQLLAECLVGVEHEDIFLKPVIREFLESLHGNRAL